MVRPATTCHACLLFFLSCWESPCASLMLMFLVVKATLWPAYLLLFWSASATATPYDGEHWLTLQRPTDVVGIPAMFEAGDGPPCGSLSASSWMRKHVGSPSEAYMEIFHFDALLDCSIYFDDDSTFFNIVIKNIIFQYFPNIL